MCKIEKSAHFTQYERKKKTTSVWVNLCINASCYSTRACAYNFLTIFSLSMYLTLSSLSLPLRRTTLFFFLSSIFLPLINLSSSSVDRHCRRSLFLPCFSLFLGWMGLISGFRVECLSPSPPLAFGGVDLVSRSRHRHRRCRCKLLILFLILAIATGGVDLVAQGETSILISRFWSILLGLFFWFSVGALCGFRCDTGVDCECGLMAVWVKKWIFYLNKYV